MTFLTIQIFIKKGISSSSLPPSLPPSLTSSHNPNYTLKHDTDCGKTITLDVNPSDSIKTVKAKIQDKEGMVPTHYFRLKFNCKYLDDDKTVEFYQVVKESTLWMVWPLPGDVRGKVDGLGAVSSMA